MKKQIAYTLLITTTIIWGLAFVFQKDASVIPPFSVGMLRSLFAAVFLLCVMPITDRLTKNGRGASRQKLFFLDFNRHELISGAMLGVIITAATAFQQYGLGGGTDAGKAAFITALYVVAVPIMSTLLGKKPSLTVIISIPIAILGFFLLCIKPGATLELSDLLVLVCAIIFAVHIIVVDRYSQRCDGVRMSFIQFVVAFLLNGIIALIFEPGVELAVIADILPSVLYLGLFSSGMGYTMQIIGQRDVDPTVASIILSMESVFGAIFAAMVLNERMIGREYIGCAIVLVAVILAQLDTARIRKWAENLSRGKKHE
ncbi:MAG: DMT family transporter [Clostridia bacterium]|nr:DMT family transporter [Clostridia bacterium]